jgi:hypothetical protein
MANLGLSPEARRSINGGVVSLLVDSYDIYLPAFVLPAVMGYFEPSSTPASLKAALTTVVFTVTLLGRPIGGPSSATCATGSAARGSRCSPGRDSRR